MRTKPEILLVNTYAPRPRSISDTALENSLAILRTYLETKNIRAEIVDDLRMDFLEEGIPRWGQQLLQGITRWQIEFSRQKTLSGILFLAAWPLHAFALYRRRQHMQRRIRYMIQDLKTRCIPFLGIKLWYGDAYIWGRELAAEARKEYPDTIIIAGGPQVKVYGDFVLSETDFDLAIMGPGEEILENLIVLYRQSASRQEFFDQVRAVHGDLLIKSSSFNGDRSSVIRQLDEQTIPVYRAEDITDKILFHTIVDGIGCSWNRCNFCSHSRCRVIATPRPVGDIIAEIEAMLAQGIAFFRFSSSETSIEHGRKIAEAILARGVNIRFSMFVRAAKPTAETMEAYQTMIRAGLRAVFMGGETGHDVVNRDIMNKGVARKDIVDTIATIRLASDAVGQVCRVGLALIYPCPLPPDVTLDEVYHANVELIDETLPDTVIVNPPGPFPGTQWFDEAERFGFQFTDGPQSFARGMMQYEYSIYKPAELWPELGFTLQGRDGKALLKETGRLRAYAASIGIPTDISDEYLMMTEAIGLVSRLDMMQFKQQTLLDIISGSTGHTRRIAAAINAASRRLAAANVKAAKRRRQRLANNSDDRFAATGIN
ncbi:MAG: radical SAM protein [Negativicutes bacterium]|nr:radical SAM protein [Negativicutes bacterium]